MAELTAKIIDGIRFPCPFCKEEVSAGVFLVEDEQKDGVSHAMPMCETFLKLEPEEFMRAARCAITGVS